MTKLTPAAMKLTPAERKKLTLCETQIATSIAKIGVAFRAIRDERLYRQTHSSFEAYCRERWNLTRRTIDRRIRFELAVAEAATHGSQLPKNERQSREQTGKLRVMLQTAPVKAELKGKPVAAEIVDAEWEPVTHEPIALPQETIRPKLPPAEQIAANLQTIVDALLSGLDQWRDRDREVDDAITLRSLATSLTRAANRAREEADSLRHLVRLNAAQESPDDLAESTEPFADALT